MMDYEQEPCKSCGEHTVIYHQYVADERCESCGDWQSEVDSEVDTD